MVRHIQRDDLDKPPMRERLPDWHGGQRRPERPLPAWVWPLAIVSVCAVLLVLLALIWPNAQALGELWRGMLVEYAPHVRLVLFVAFLLGVAGAVGFVWRAGAAVGALGQRARVIRTQHDAPIDVSTLRRPEWGATVDGSLLAHYLTQQTWAANSGARGLTTYAPAFHNRQDMQGAPALPAALPLPAVPSFGELLAAGRIGQGVPLLLGIDAESGEPVTGSFKSLYSMGVGGLQGSGKTWTAASLLAQSALHGARLVVCDPHAGDAESLAARVSGLAPAFLCDVAEDDKAIFHALRLASDELKTRRGGAPQRWPLIVAVDEWTALRRGRLAQLLPLVVEDFSTEGRKFNCHVALLGQRWDKASVGDFRNTLASAYVHRLRPDEARMLTGLPAGVLPRDTMGLAPGESYLVDTSGVLRRVYTPRLMTADIDECGRRLGGPHAPAPRAVAASVAEGARAFGFAGATSAGPAPEVASEVASEVATSVHQNAARPLDARALRIRALLAEKTPLRKIIEAEWGVTGGDAYAKATRELSEIIAQLVTEGGVK